MEILIIKNGHIFARATDPEFSSADDYVLMTTEVPPYPAESAGSGKEWELDIVDSALTWTAIDRPLTVEERLSAIEEQTNAWKANESVNVNDRRFFNGTWYICVQAHTTLDGWTPDLTPALWRAD